MGVLLSLIMMGDTLPVSPMRIVSGTDSRALHLARVRELTREARIRLQWMDYYEAHGRKVALSCRHFGISRQTFYRWKRQEALCL